MEHLPPTGWGDVARQRDLDRLEVAMRADVDRLEVTISREIEVAMRQQANRYIGWMVATNATLVAAVSLIVGLR